MDTDGGEAVPEGLLAEAGDVLGLGLWFQQGVVNNCCELGC